jgi:hypothetical protein
MGASSDAADRLGLGAEEFCELAGLVAGAPPGLCSDHAGDKSKAAIPISLG